jgi:hypothetical protein
MPDLRPPTDAVANGHELHLATHTAVLTLTVRWRCARCRATAEITEGRQTGTATTTRCPFAPAIAIPRQTTWGDR